jgi:prepilin-type N-terminal cleavage/methylation domain-containing protein
MNYKLQIKKQKNNRGFTLLETMVSVALFTIVMTAGMGSLLNANLLNNKAKSMRSIMDNLSFVMDDMSKNIRTGTDYECISSGTAGSVLSSLTPLSGSNCWGIAFEPSDGGSQWAYEVVKQISPTTAYYIEKTTDGGQSWVILTPSEAAIDTTLSGFSILGAEPPPNAANSKTGTDYQQPLVNIRLVGSITYQKAVTPFSLQTSVSQMGIDI